MDRLEFRSFSNRSSAIVKLDSLFRLPIKEVIVWRRTVDEWIFVSLGGNSRVQDYAGLSNMKLP